MGFATGMPLVGAALAIGAAVALGLAPGNAFLLCALAASASYIAVPAAMRHAIPEADPGLYVTSAIALTFPFNILFGLPSYLAALRAVLA